MSPLPENWYLIPGAENLDSPALVIYEELVKQNIATLKRMIDDVSRLRIHIKTNKSREATQLMLDAGIYKFKCATIAEGEMLGMIKAEDVLLAYQPVGPKINRLTALIRRYPQTRYSCLIDNKCAATQISSLMKGAGLCIDVYIDLNVGMNRTGVKPGKEAVELFELCSSLPGVNPVGLHAYDGHIHEPDLARRTLECNESFAPVESLVSELSSKGFNASVVAGGTPTFPIHIKRNNVECSPGTFIYWDRGYSESYKEQAFVYAALIICRVISLPEEGLLCLDAGHKAVAAENELNKRIYFLNAPELEVVSQSEEHLVVRTDPGHRYQPGDILYGVPRHICPTVALYERAFVINENEVSGEWKNIARDRKINC